MGLRVALLGTFDVDNYGDHLFPRIAVRELARRLPDATIDCYAPLGPLHPTRLTGGPEVRAIGPWRDDRLHEFASIYDALIVGGGELLHLNDPLLGAFYGVEPSAIDLVQPSRWFLEGVGREREASCPVLWHAIGVPYDLDPQQAARVRQAFAHRTHPPVVRDHRSKDRLLAAGVRGPVEVVPDSGLLVDRLFAPGELDRRRRVLGLPVGPTLVVQGCDLLVPSAESIAAEAAAIADAHGLAIVVAETGRCRGDGDFADAVERALGERRRVRMPAGASVEDIAAALSSAGLFLGSSLHGAITALAHGRPFVLLNLGDESKLRGFVESAGLEPRLVEEVGEIGPAAAKALAAPPPDALVRRLQDEVDRHFDALASALVARSKIDSHYEEDGLRRRGRVPDGTRPGRLRRLFGLVGR